MNVQIEIGTTKHWMILPAYLRLFRSRYEPVSYTHLMLPTKA